MSDQYQLLWKPLPEASFYNAHSADPAMGAKIIPLNEEIIKKGLMLRDKDLKRIKKEVLDKVFAKEESGEWTFEKSLNSDRGKAKMKALLNDIRAKAAPQFGWNRITPYDKDWFYDALKRILNKQKQKETRARKRKADLLSNIEEDPRIRAIPAKTGSPWHLSTPLSQTSTLALSKENHIEIASSPYTAPIQALTTPQGNLTSLESIQSPNSLLEMWQSNHDTTPSPLPHIMLESPNDKATISQGFSIPGLTPSSQSIPAQPIPVQGARPEVFTLQPPTLLPRIFPSTPTNQLTNSGGQYDAMLLAVFASAPVEAHLDSYPWRDILTQYLYEGSRSIASTKLTPSDFNFTKFKAALPDPSQSLFGFDEAKHQLVGRAGVQEIIIQYEGSWRIVLQQAASQSATEITFEVRNKV